VVRETRRRALREVFVAALAPGAACAKPASFFLRKAQHPGQIVAQGVDSRRTDGLFGYYLLTPVTQP
jgi:hypothetical protein